MDLDLHVLDPGRCDLGPIVRRLTDHFRRYAYSDATRWCWQVFSTLTSFDGQVCFEYNCPDRDVFHRELAALDAANTADCPAHSRYYNVPSFWRATPPPTLAARSTTSSRSRRRSTPTACSTALSAA